ncbi:hypothetical protein [Nitrosarchaeum sp.]|uniref:hypothetical protein n=1 Tax=Nitrosarchaeum sp. TaxID=2026886 RepID=UPI00247C50A2|nr:hypothetical protein [Nitrosarchaeum sp.]MCV0413221.1 hypothetical protein [Nitrosarchaeum sp.]
MKTRLLVVWLIVMGFVVPIHAQDQLLTQNPDEPNLFGYFVLAMSIVIVSSFIILKFKKWKRK